MAADELKDYLENGNILHSVNLPNVSMPRDSAFSRICIIHRNVPNTISLLAGKLAEFGINIENMQSKSRKDYAYTLLDCLLYTSQYNLAAIVRLFTIYC